jgi:peptidoglycan DL-endopeptidase CwlO
MDMPHSRHVTRHSAPTKGRARIARRTAVLAAAATAAAVCAVIFPVGVAGAAPASGNPSLNAVLAKANALSEQIDNLSEQYDGLRLQLNEAQAEVAIAKEDAARDQAILSQDQAYIGAIAVENYMTAGMNPELQLLQGSSPQNMLNQASIMTQIEQENGAKVNLVVAAQTAARRAQAAAGLEQQHAKALTGAMAAKVAVIQQKENFFNGEAYKQAEAIFEQTGNYPITPSQIPGDSVGVQALKFALTRIGDPYVWGAAGPSSFDCSGLVVWAYAQVGISLEHFTGDLWNEVQHVSVNELKPGDLVFFYPDIGHVGIYVGNGLMVDAPTFGQTVQIQPVMYNVLVGAGEVIA